MTIEYKNIIINKNNIAEYQNLDYLTGGEYAPKWTALGEIAPDGDKVILYKYSIDSELNLSPYDKLRDLVKSSNEEMPYSLIHESHHSHNANTGFSFNQINRICYTYIAAYLLDEISARMAANMYRVPNPNTQFDGLNIKERALLSAIQSFSDKQLCIEYCNLAATTYMCCIVAMLRNGQINHARDIVLKQIPLHADYKKHRRFYTDNFYNTVNQYFVIDNIDVKPSIGQEAKLKFEKIWQTITPIIFNMSQQCLMYIKQNCL
ncbi:MAG: hypothetical protein IJE79_01920 [Alphaproteobacteria bacterium]|nr:hypothetical protein [Alphaproteobacteria bacterium]